MISMQKLLLIMKFICAIFAAHPLGSVVNLLLDLANLSICTGHPRPAHEWGRHNIPI
jgi:hypothetical protein